MQLFKLKSCKTMSENLKNLGIIFKIIERIFSYSRITFFKAYRQGEKLIKYCKCNIFSESNAFFDLFSRNIIPNVDCDIQIFSLCRQHIINHRNYILHRSGNTSMKSSNMYFSAHMNDSVRIEREADSITYISYLFL